VQGAVEYGRGDMGRGGGCAGLTALAAGRRRGCRDAVVAKGSWSAGWLGCRCAARSWVPAAGALRRHRGCRPGGLSGRCLPGRLLPPGARWCRGRWPAPGCGGRGLKQQLDQRAYARPETLPGPLSTFWASP